MKMQTKKGFLPLIIALSIVSSSCSLNHSDRKDGVFSKLGRYLASADTIESEMASVRSIVLELNTNGTKVADLYAYPTFMKVNSFYDNERITTALSKLKKIQGMLLVDTSKTAPTTKEGKKLLNLVADYLQAIVTINKFYALLAHKNAPSSYDWSQLDKYNLLLDKRYALVLLSKVNFFARHMSDAEVTNLGQDPKKVKNAVEIQLGGEARQMLEHLAVNNPETPTQYAKLLKFNAVRETLINTWGINRIAASTQYDPYTTDVNAKSTLTFRPGADGKFKSGTYYKELDQSDKFYNIYTPVLKEIVMATVSDKKVNNSIASVAEYAEIYRTLIWGYPEGAEKKTIEPFGPVADYFLAQGKYEGEVPWTREYVDMMFTGEEIKSVEEADWTNEKAVNLFYTALVGDDLDPKKLTEQMVEYAWLTRSIAVVTQVRHRIENADMTELEVQKLTNKIWQIVGRWKGRYVAHLTSKIQPLMDKYLLPDNVKKAKRNAKYSGLADVVKMTEAARATYVKSSMSGKNGQIPGIRMFPRTPESLVSLVQYRLAKNTTYKNYNGVLFALEDNSEIAGVVRQFYKDISNAFYKRSKVDDSFQTMSQILWEEAHKIATNYAKKYPWTQAEQDRYSFNKYLEENPAAPRDNTYVYVNPWVPNPNYQGGTAKKGSTTSTKTASTSSSKNKALSFDQKLLQMMQTFQPYMQGTERSELSTHGARNSHSKYINIQYENWRANETYQTAGQVLDSIFMVMGLSYSGIKAGTYPAKYDFAKQWDDQLFLSEQAISMAYQAAPLLQNEVYSHTTTETIREPGDGQGFKGRTYTIEKKHYCTALEWIGRYAYNPQDASVDSKKVATAIANAISSAMSSLKGQAHGTTPATPFKEGLLETFAKSNPSSYASDKRFNFMYDKLEQLRGIMMSAPGQPQAVAEKLEKLDYELYKKIHPWKYVFERYIEPIVNIVIVCMMVISFIVGLVFPPAAMPAWLAMSLFVFEVSAFTFTMASNVGYRIMYQRMYEIPANLKMQTHLASISGGEESPLKLMYDSASGLKTYGISTPLDNFDRIKAAEQANIDERRSMILERLFWLPLDMLWGASILKMGKNLVGISTVKSLKKLGLPHLTFNEKVKVIFKTDQWKLYIQEKGLIRGIKQASTDIVQGMPQVTKLLPKYQPYTKGMLQENTLLRAGLYNKIEGITLARAAETGSVTVQKTTKLVDGVETALYTLYKDGKVIGTSKYPLIGENLTLYQLFDDIKKFDEKQWKLFIEFQETHETTKLYNKIQALLEKGYKPAEIMGMPIGRAPKTLFGVFFNGMTSKSRMSKLTSTLKEGMEGPEMLLRYREAKALGNQEALVKFFEEVTVPGYKFDDLVKVFDEAGMSIFNPKNLAEKLKSNFDAWKLNREPEMKLLNMQMELQMMFNNAKHVRSKKLMDKVTEIENMMATNAIAKADQQYQIKSMTDYFMSIMDHSDLMLWQEIVSKAPRGSTSRQIKTIFTEHRTIMETIRPYDWKKALENYKPNTELVPTVSTHADDFNEIIVQDGNIFPADGFGDAKTPDMKNLQDAIEEAL